MFKKAAAFIFSGFLLLNICGCFLLVAGAVGGAGTAVWLSGKLTQQFNAPYDRTVNATNKALRSFNFEIEKVAKEAEVTTFRSHYTDGKEIWIDVRKVTEESTKVEIRVGGVSADKEACTKILERIKNYL
jgi:predicted phage tail protein